jgi:hypothetical protein
LVGGTVFESNPPGRARRVAVGLLAASFTLGVAPVAVAAPPEPPPSFIDAATIRADEDRLVEGSPTVVRGTCNHLTFHTEQARRWTNNVHRLTDLTCREARWVWTTRPAWRDDMPYSVLRTSGAIRVPSPAVAERELVAPATTRYCKVWTTTKYRDWPFGNTLLSMRMEQTFRYDGVRVYPRQALLYPDTTTNGFRWHFSGVVNAQDVYSTIRAHTSERWSNFTSTGILGLGSVTTTLYTKIWTQANGDWATSHRDGLSECRNP